VEKFFQISTILLDKIQIGSKSIKMSPLLMYMVFGLPNSAEQWILRFPFGPVESVGEAGPGGGKSTAVGQKLVGIAR
jgi:hypothetical protein